jgi:nucleotide-binding universal stress UspA family protein
MTLWRTILCPVDFSELSPACAAYARYLAERVGGRVVCLFVAPSFEEFAELAAAPGTWLGMSEEMSTGAEKIMEVFVRENFAEGQAEGRLRTGEPARGILDEAEALGAELIVMGTHGRTGFDRVLFGSVAEKVVRTSSCPVLTVRAKP